MSVFVEGTMQMLPEDLNTKLASDFNTTVSLTDNIINEVLSKTNESQGKICTAFS
jgi:hypothetical protein